MGFYRSVSNSDSEVQNSIQKFMKAAQQSLEQNEKDPKARSEALGRLAYQLEVDLADEKKAGKIKIEDGKNGSKVVFKIGDDGSKLKVLEMRPGRGNRMTFSSFVQTDFHELDGETLVVKNGKGF